MTNHTIETLTPHQIAFACALTETPQTVAAIKTQANADGFYIEKVMWKELIRLEVAQYDGYHLKRGTQWGTFYDLHGRRATKQGLDSLWIEKELREIFTAEVLPFPNG